MADEMNQQQNQQKQKGGNQQGAKAGITLGTSVSAVGNSNLGETIRGALADSFGYMMGAISTGVAAHFMNRVITRFKPTANTPEVFPAKSEGPTARELMGQMHNLARTNPDEAQRILASVGSRFQQSPIAVEKPVEPASVPTPEVKKPEPKQEVKAAPAAKTTRSTAAKS